MNTAFAMIENSLTKNEIEDILKKFIEEQKKKSGLSIKIESNINDTISVIDIPNLINGMSIDVGSNVNDLKKILNEMDFPNSLISMRISDSKTEHSLFSNSIDSKAEFFNGFNRYSNTSTSDLLEDQITINRSDNDFDKYKEKAADKIVKTVIKKTLEKVGSKVFGPIVDAIWPSGLGTEKAIEDPDSSEFKERAERQKTEKEKTESEKADKEKTDKEKADKEKADKEKADKEKADKEKTDKETTKYDPDNPHSPENIESRKRFFKMIEEQQQKDRENMTPEEREREKQKILMALLMETAKQMKDNPEKFGEWGCGSVPGRLNFHYEKNNINFFNLK